MKPLKESIRSRIKRLLAADKVTLQDRAVMQARGWNWKEKRSGRKKV